MADLSQYKPRPVHVVGVTGHYKHNTAVIQRTDVEYLGMLAFNILVLILNLEHIVPQAILGGGIASDRNIRTFRFSRALAIVNSACPNKVGSCYKRCGRSL